MRVTGHGAALGRHHARLEPQLLEPLRRQAALGAVDAVVQVMPGKHDRRLHRQQFAELQPAAGSVMTGCLVSTSERM